MVEDSPKKPTAEELESQKAKEEKRKEKLQRKKMKRKTREKALELLRARRKKELENASQVCFSVFCAYVMGFDHVVSLQQKASAKEFISSSRLIDDGFDGSANPQMVKAELLTAVERLGPRLPPNTLDQLIDELGGPEFVAEVRRCIRARRA